MKVSTARSLAALTLLATALVACGQAVNDEVTKKEEAPDTLAAAPAGELALTVPADTLKSPSEQLTVAVVDSSGKKQVRTLSGADVSKISFSGLKAGSAKISARLEGANGGDLEAAGAVDIVAGKQVSLELALTPANGGGLDIIITRPDEPTVPPAELKPDAKSLLSLVKVPENETFTFRSKIEVSKLPCNGFETVIAFESDNAVVMEYVCGLGKVQSVGAPATIASLTSGAAAGSGGGEIPAPGIPPPGTGGGVEMPAPGIPPPGTGGGVEIPPPRTPGGVVKPFEGLSMVNAYYLSDPKSIVGLANLLNSIQKNRMGGVVSQIACLPAVGAPTFKLTHDGNGKPRTYSSLGSNGCAKDSDFVEKQARDVHAAILKFAKDNNESIIAYPTAGEVRSQPASIK
jgi:hypothetical protein